MVKVSPQCRKSGPEGTPGPDTTKNPPPRGAADANQESSNTAKQTVNLFMKLL